MAIAFMVILIIQLTARNKKKSFICLDKYYSTTSNLSSLRERDLLQESFHLPTHRYCCNQHCLMLYPCNLKHEHIQNQCNVKRMSSLLNVH